MTVHTSDHTVPALPAACAHLHRNAPGWIDIAYKPIDGRGLTIDVRPERLRDRNHLTAFAQHAAYRWLAGVRNAGLLPLALDARLPARALASGADSPALAQADVAALVNRLRARVAEAGGSGQIAFPDVLIRVSGGAHQVRVAGTDQRVLAMRDALAAEVLGWLAVHGRWWDAAGNFAVKLEPSTR